MITFKKREVVYKPYETVFRMIVNMIMIMCMAYLIVLSFFHKTTVIGHSMSNTLQNRDTVLINSIAYSFHAPERFDLIVFKPKSDGISEYYVKRVIGLPGETVQIIDGIVYIDGNPLKNDVIDIKINNPGLAAEPIKLDYNEYFVLGDNRNNSDDSRFSNIGMVKQDRIVGKPWLIVSPVSRFGIIDIQTITTDDDKE